MSRLLIGLAAAFACGGTALAQDTELGSRLRKRVDTQVRGAEESVIAAHRYARCIANKRTGSARRLLEVTTEAEYETYNRVLGREVTCSSLVDSVIQQTGQSVAMSRDVYRGNMAEAVMRSAGAQPVPAALPLQAQYSSPFTEVSGRNVVVEEMGVCLAATQPAAVAGVLASDPASAGEAAAIRVMTPMLVQCLTANAKLTANRQALRATMAEAYYHRLTAPVATAAVQK